jgi:hypothetical protein
MKLRISQFCFIFSLLLLFAGQHCAAANKRFRYGTVLAAQMSKRMVAVSNLNSYDTSVLKHIDSKIYAEVVVRLDKGRSLSVFDFSLKKNSSIYSCIAIREGNGDFNATKKTLTAADDKLYTLLFIVDIPEYSSSSELYYTLRFNLSNSGMVDTPLHFQNLYYSSFSGLDSIGKNGILLKCRR